MTFWRAFCWRRTFFFLYMDDAHRSHIAPRRGLKKTGSHRKPNWYRCFVLGRRSDRVISRSRWRWSRFSRQYVPRWVRIGVRGAMYLLLRRIRGLTEAVTLSFATAQRIEKRASAVLLGFADSTLKLQAADVFHSAVTGHHTSPSGSLYIRL
jgi:hypothetical protein